MGRDHSIECERCGESYGGFNDPDGDREHVCDAPHIANLVLHCPKCGLLHLDVDEWRDRPHKTHLCLNEKCGHLWRPEEAHTRGVSPAEASLYELTRSLTLTTSHDEMRELVAGGRSACGHLAVFMHYDGGLHACQVCGFEE